MRLALIVGVAVGVLAAAESGSPVMSLILVVVLLACSAFFSGSETALFSLQPLDRRSLGPNDAVEQLLLHPRRSLASILIGNEFVNVLLSTVTAGLILTVAPDSPWINVVVLTPVLVVMGEVLPKVTALRFNRTMAPIIATPLLLFSRFVAPLRWLLTTVADFALRLTGGSKAPQAQHLREAQLRELVEQGRRAGSIDPMEQEMIEKVFEFGEHSVRRLMTPRTDVFSLNLMTPWEDMLPEIRRAGFSRVPVWTGSPDHIIGILLVKKLLPMLLSIRKDGKAPPTPRQIRKLLLPPRFVPTSKRAEDLLQEFRDDRFHMAVVVDEHGGLSGVVTLDDLLAELVGELLDETDSEDNEVTAHGGGLWTVQASMDVDDFQVHFGIELPEGDYTTVGGFVLAEAGALPDKGDELEWGRLKFTVVGREGHRITELSVQNSEGSIITQEVS